MLASVQSFDIDLAKMIWRIEITAERKYPSSTHREKGVKNRPGGTMKISD